MKLRRLCAPIVALGLLVPLARGEQPATAVHKPKNAALEYWPVFAVMEQFSEGDLKTIDNWRTVPLDKAAVGLVYRGAQYPMNFQHLHAGALADTCDWGLDFSNGPYVSLPHVNYGRRLAHRGCLRIRYDLQQKNFPAAVDDTRDVLMLGRNLASDPLIIVRLVRFGIEREAIDAIAMDLDDLDADSLKKLTAMLDELPRPTNEADTLKFESKVIPEWAIGKIGAAGPHPDWLSILGFISGAEGNPPGAEPLDKLIASAGGTPESVTAAIRNLLTYYEEAEKLVAAPATQYEFQQKAEALRHRFDANPLAKSLLPNLVPAHNAEVAAATRFVLLKAAVAVVQGGPDTVKGFEDPVNHQPITYEKQASGFQLKSKVMLRNEPLTLTVGGAK